MKDVTLEISFEDLFGKNKEDIASCDKKFRWIEWKKIVIKKLNKEEAKAVFKFWMPADTCRNCVYREGEWCVVEDLPCSVNPILSFRLGIPGLACRGLGPHTQMPVDMSGADTKIYASLKPYNRAICDRNLAIINEVGVRRGKDAEVYINCVWNIKHLDQKISYTSFKRIRRSYKSHGISGICGKYGNRAGQKLESKDKRND